MKKYKLLKWYPSLSKDIEVGEMFIEYCGSYLRRGCFYSITKQEVENNPEFWEEVKEKEEYQIISIISFQGHVSDRINELGQVGWSDDTWFQFYDPKDLIKASHKIHSVKRLSDGEVFTVGDLCESPSGIKGKIEKIEITESSNFRFISTGHWNVFGHHLKHCKEPLFTTEDGVDIYEGDTYYTVFTKEFEDIKAYKVLGVHVAKDEYHEHKGIKYFKEKEKAEEYIEENRPQYSKKDMIDFCLYSRMNGNPNFKELLKQWMMKTEK